MLNFENVLTKLENGVFWLTINRPNDRNALNSETLGELVRAFEWIEENDEVRVVVIQGVGEKAFAAGADIRQLYERENLEALEPGIQKVFNVIEESSKVTIAAVNGYALGGGCELALACDIRIAAENAKFGLPELNLGIIPGGGGTQRLARIIGKGRALDMVLTGEIIDTETAKEYGLVKQVIKQDEWKEQIVSIAEKVIKKGPIAVRLAKLAIHQGFEQDMKTALLIEKLAQTIAFSTEDRKEGTKAFIEKRTARFANK